MSNKETKPKLIINPLKIKTTGLMIHEGLIPEKETEIRIDFNHNFSLLENTDIVLFELEVLYFVSREDLPDLKVLACLVENYYQIPNIEQFKNENGLFNLPTSDFVTIVSLSISHSRAIVATHCLGTIYEKTLVPIVDPILVAASFFHAKKQESVYPLEF